MQLLQDLEDRGYPAEYLLSRIRGRRARLISDWNPLIFEAAVPDYLSSVRYRGFVKETSPGSIWKNVIAEYRWVYVQMNGQLRQLFGPFFLYAELRTLFIGLRHLKDRNPGRARELLNVSLLSDEVKDLLIAGNDLAAAIRDIERFFLPISDRFAGLTETLKTEGLRGIEQKITNTYLAVIFNSKLHPIMRNFFARLIDSRNIMNVYKYLKLEQQKGLPVIPGGSIPKQKFLEVVAKEDLFGVCSLIREFFRIKVDTPDPTKIEIALYKGITRFLKNAGRELLGAGLILDYLWKCSVEAMNLSILIHGKDLEPGAVKDELVQ